MKLTASKLRENIYRILDRVAKTGEPVDIQRGETTLSIVPKSRLFRKLSRLQKQSLTDEDSDRFEHIDWSSEWNG